MPKATQKYEKEITMEQLERPPEGFLHVGVDPDTFEVVINLDADRVGHITFTAAQARSLANILEKKALELDLLVSCRKE